MKFSRQLKIAMVLVLIPLSLAGEIAEKDLDRDNEAFIERMIGDSPHLQREIILCLNAGLNRRHSGSRLLDRFGVFMNDCRNDGMSLGKTRFFFWEKSFALFIVLTDTKDNQNYTLYLEYAFYSDEKYCVLREIYFSPVFTDKIAALQLLFGGGVK